VNHALEQRRVRATIRNTEKEQATAKGDESETGGGTGTCTGVSYGWGPGTLTVGVVE